MINTISTFIRTQKKVCFLIFLNRFINSTKYFTLSLLFILTISNSYSQTKDNYDECISSFLEDFNMENPTELDSLKIKLECILYTKEYEKGLKLVDSLIQSNPSDGSLYHLKGNILYRDIRDTAYIQYYRKAAQLGFLEGREYLTIGQHYLSYSHGNGFFESPLNLSDADVLKILMISKKNIHKALAITKDYSAECYESLVKIQSAENYINKIELKPLQFNQDFDTLIIMSFLMDCGEFGGHMEYIKFFHENDNIVGVYSQDQPVCMADIQPKKELYADYKQDHQIISPAQLKMYIDHFNSIQKDIGYTSNAPSEFWLLIDGVYYFKRDWSGNSLEYEILRNSLFK